MIDFNQLSRLNDRSRLFNGPMKAIFIRDIAGEGIPYISYQRVNAKKGDFTEPIYNFIAKLVCLEIYAVNIESVSEFFECYDIVGAELHVRASYCDVTSILSIYVFDALVAEFLTYELEENCIKNLTQKVATACKQHRIPLGEHGMDIIECEIKRCIEEDINSLRPMQVQEYTLDKWLLDEEPIFNVE